MDSISKNATNAVNQQGSLFLKLDQIDPSETTRRAPLSRKVIKAYLLGCLHDGTYSSWHPRKVKTLRKRMVI